VAKPKPLKPAGQKLQILCGFSQILSPVVLAGHLVSVAGVTRKLAVHHIILLRPPLHSTCPADTERSES